MLNLLNKLFIVLKLLLLLLGLGFSAYIMLSLYTYLEKNLFSSQITDFIKVIIPYLILLLLIVLNLLLRNKEVNDNILYNFCSVIGLVAIVFILYRSIFDNNIILSYKNQYNIAFDYFSDQLSFIKIILYSLSIVDILLIIENRILKKKELEIEI